MKKEQKTMDEMIKKIAEEIIFATAVAQAPHAEWEHLSWEDMTDEDKEPFLVGARRVIRLLNKET